MRSTCLVSTGAPANVPTGSLAFPKLIPAAADPTIRVTTGAEVSLDGRTDGATPTEVTVSRRNRAPV